MTDKYNKYGFNITENSDTGEKFGTVLNELGNPVFMYYPYHTVDAVIFNARAAINNAFSLGCYHSDELLSKAYISGFKDGRNDR